MFPLLHTTCRKSLSLALSITTVASSWMVTPAATASASFDQNQGTTQSPVPTGQDFASSWSGVLAATQTPAPAATQTPTPAPTQTPTPAPTYKITPDKIQTGKKPNVKITTDTGDLTGVEPQAPDSSSGVTFEATSHVDTKTIVFAVDVSEDADLGPIQINLMKGNTVVSVVELTILEFRPRKISRGPTPDDLEFDVDAMWNVLPYKVVKTNFGRRAADSFYAVEVFLGNNSGFDLQIVGVGFESTLGNPSELDPTTGKPLQPLLDDKGKPILDNRGNRLIPDLDYTAKSPDGKPLYVQKKGPDDKPLFKPHRSYHLPTSDHRLVRGSIEVDQLYGSRSLTLNLIGGVGTLLSGFIPFFHRPNPKANFSTFSSILNGQFKEGFGIAAPDLTVSQLNRLENLVLHDGLTVLNNSQARTIVFFPRHVVALDKTERRIIDRGESMWPLMDKLGELIIVGKPVITFRNREIVATKPQPAAPPATPSTPVIGAPTVTSFPPGVHAAKAKITISGTNFVPGTQVTFGGVPSPEVIFITPTQLNVTIPENARTGFIEVKTPSGSNKSSTEFIAEPKITSISPKSGTKDMPVVITGLNLQSATQVTFGGVTAKINEPKSEEKLNVSVPDKAISGVVSVTTSGGKADSPDAEKFVAQPILKPLADAAKKGGAGDSITIEGNNLDGAEVLFGNVSAKILESDSTHVKVEVPANAVTDVITVKTPVGRVTTEKFTFIPKPTITGFLVNSGAESPSATVKGGDVVTIVGQNLAGATLTLGETAVTTTTVEDAKVVFTVPANLTGGKVTVKVKTAGGEVSTDKFTYTPAPKITGFSVGNAAAAEMASGKAGDTVVIKGENFNGVTSVKFGGNEVTPTDKKEKEITVKVPAGLTAGKIKIEITTPGGTVSNENFTFTIAP